MVDPGGPERDYERRLASWLGLDPGTLLEIEETREGRFGAWMVRWYSTVPQAAAPSPGRRFDVPGSTVRRFPGDVARYHAGVLLHPEEAGRLRAEVGYRPGFDPS